MASLRGHVLNTVIRVASKRRLAKLVLTPEAIAATRTRMDRLGDRKLPPTLSRHADELNGVATEWTRVHGTRRGVIFYCHGGGYFVGSPRVYRGIAARLATLTNCDVAVIDYRLAPEHVYPAAPDDALLAYRALLARAIDPASLVIAGDSAGGNLALVTLLRARDRGLPLPAAGVLLSPWTDLTGSGASMRTNERRDPMLPAHRVDDAARMYAPHHEPADPDLSPLFADFTGLPPLSIHVGSTEILLDDSRRLEKRARAHGVDATVRVWHRMPHVFPMFADFIPEGRRALREIQQFIDARISNVPAAVAR
ncbi:MAG TPA: alpha/beta hydrolase [Pseudomonadales bacterium]|nr:alpha/beta hydrolase [Pseudomonadales bacterium]